MAIEEWEDAGVRIPRHAPVVQRVQVIALEAERRLRRRCEGGAGEPHLRRR